MQRDKKLLKLYFILLPSLCLTPLGPSYPYNSHNKLYCCLKLHTFRKDTMFSNKEVLRSVPNFPNYSYETFGYPERLIRKSQDSMVVLGPPIHLYYSYRPHKSCQVHASGIPDWASMSDVVEIFERFGKIFSVELFVSIKPSNEPTNKTHNLVCNGSARVTFISYDGAQKAMFAHLTRRIPGSVLPLSIYKGVVNNVVLLKNLPTNEPKSGIIECINGYPGLISISFASSTTARLVFFDLDLALLFMDVVSGGGVIINGFTCTVEPEDQDDDDEGIFI